MVSPQWMIRRPAPATTQATWSSPRQSSDVTGVTDNGPMLRVRSKSWGVGSIPAAASVGAIGAWQPTVPGAAIRASTVGS